MIYLQLIMMFVLFGGGAVYCAACFLAFSGHFRRTLTVENYSPSISVIVAARNEEKHIGLLLKDLMEQDYPTDLLQIVVVDDCSDDNTAGVVKRFIAADDRVCLRNTRDSQSPYSHKKRAVHEGIMASDGEIIMTTDADCRVPRSWVREMVKHFAPGVDLVAGMVLVKGGGFFGWLEALELTGIQMMASGLMNARFPVTCNGANLAYRRSAFERVGGFEGVGNIVSGDDDLLMQKIAQEESSGVVFVTETGTAVHAGAADNLRGFFSQRARWTSKIGGYPSLHAKALMAIFFGFFSVMPVWLMLALFHRVSFFPLIAAYCLKTAGDVLLTGYGVLKGRKPELMLLFPLAEILHVPYIIGVTLRGFFGSFEWRGRRTRAVNIEYGQKTND